MKKFKKILIIFTLGFYLSGMLIPQKEKEAHAFVLTSTIALGALAFAGMGGVIAYHNRDAIMKVGQDVASKLADSGIDAENMYTTNMYGLTDTVKMKIAETIQETQVTQSSTLVKTGVVPMPHGTDYDLVIPSTMLAALTADESIFLKVTSVEENTALTYLDLLFRGVTSTQFKVGTTIYPEKYGVLISKSSQEYIREIPFSIISQITNARIEFYSPYNLAAGVTFEMQRYKSNADRVATEGITALDSYDDLTGYTNALDNAYLNTPNVSIDYDLLTETLTNAQAPPISLTNIETLVTGIESSIVDAGADTVGILSTIWNGISGIPSLIQSSSTAVLGGISTLSDDLLTGLGTFTGNITASNDQLWTDAGVVWSGMTSAIENLGTDISTSVSTAITDGLTGIDTLVGDLGTVIGTLPDTISTSVTGALTGLGDIVTDLGTTVRAIPGAITTSTTDAFTSAFAVPDNYFTTRTTAIQQIIIPKFPQLPDKELLFPSQYKEMEDWAGISADFSHYGIGEQMVIGNTAPNYYRRQIKLWISAILYFFTALFVIRKIAGVINK